MFILQNILVYGTGVCLNCLNPKSTYFRYELFRKKNISVTSKAQNTKYILYQKKSFDNHILTIFYTEQNFQSENLFAIYWYDLVLIISNHSTTDSNFNYNLICTQLVLLLFALKQHLELAPKIKVLTIKMQYANVYRYNLSQ